MMASFRSAPKYLATPVLKQQYYIFDLIKVYENDHQHNHQPLKHFVIKPAVVGIHGHAGFVANVDFDFLLD